MKFLAKKLKKALLTLGVIVTMTNVASADALDDCRNILISGNFSLKYENITPPPRQIMKEKMRLYDGKMYNIENPYTMYQPVTGIIAVSGNNRYVETNSAMNIQNVATTIQQLQAQSYSAGGIGGLIAKGVSSLNTPREYEYATCTLIKNDEKFIFTKIKSSTPAKKRVKLKQ